MGGSSSKRYLGKEIQFSNTRNISKSFLEVYRLGVFFEYYTGKFQFMILCCFIYVCFNGELLVSCRGWMGGWVDRCGRVG